MLYKITEIIYSDMWNLAFLSCDLCLAWKFFFSLNSVVHCSLEDRTNKYKIKSNKKVLHNE